MTSDLTSKIDSKDRKIISLLRKDARISQEEIAREIGISRPTVQKRIKALEEKNIILGYQIVIDEKKLGKQITAFLLVVLDRTHLAWELTYQEIYNRMEELEILEFHHVTGSEDVVLKMKTRNIDTLEDNLIKITHMKGVSRTRTMICLSSVEGLFHTTITDSERQIPPKDILWNFT